MTAVTSRRRPGPGLRGRLGKALPYLLLAPGLLWLTVFYVCPAIQMFTYSISTGSVENGFTITLAADAYAEALDKFGKQFLNSILYGGDRHDPDPPDRLPGRLHDRLPWRPLQEPDPVPRHRAVLHELPDPDDQLEDPAR